MEKERGRQVPKVNELGLKPLTAAARTVASVHESHTLPLRYCRTRICVFLHHPSSLFHRIPRGARHSRGRGQGRTRLLGGRCRTRAPGPGNAHK
ncbi:hypothetical protein AMECASPLE_013291 [Ameca splendens]|uniref:Uncharacterized protein n=1 Tax=Ameca splendens TaxID=208324 RepID=A0ABV0ZLR2_9TELE